MQLSGIKGASAGQLLALALASLSTLGNAAPHLDSPRQRLLNGLDLVNKPNGRSETIRAGKIRAGVKPDADAESPGSGTPFTPEHRDPYDRAVDSIGEGLDPLPYRNGHGASVLGPWNTGRSRQNPDLVRPPSTDHGDVSNMRWSFADSHIRIEEGGWTRQTTVRELPTSVELAAVNMRLDEGAIRELHWHKEAEWAYVLEGEVRVTALDYEGGNFLGDVKKGDLWYFPSGVPHSLQGLSPNGTEFLLIFDNGSFSEESTFILSDWLAHTPRAVVAENFNLAPEVFDHLPEKEKYIFTGNTPPPKDIKDDEPRGKHVKKSRFNFTHSMMGQEPVTTSGGDVRITDSRNFPISKTVAAAHLTIQPGALREMHWHPTDEWIMVIKGRVRITVFAAEGKARTFDYVPGDVGIVPGLMGHFIENIGDEPAETLEVFRSDEYRDFSLFQWMGETPKRLVVDHLFADDKEGGEKFWESVKDAEEDPIRKVKDGLFDGEGAGADAGAGEEEPITDEL